MIRDTQITTLSMHIFNTNSTKQIESMTVRMCREINMLKYFKIVQNRHEIFCSSTIRINMYNKVTQHHDSIMPGTGESEKFSQVRVKVCIISRGSINEQNQKWSGTSKFK